MYDKKEALLILKKIFKDNVNYSFNGDQEVKSFKVFIHKVLNHADYVYTEEYHWRKYPNFLDFLYSYEVDSIAYSVYEGDL